MRRILLVFVLLGLGLGLVLVASTVGAGESGSAEEFEIATVNGEDADQVNEVPFYRGQPLTVELDGIDLERNHFEAYLDDQRVGSLNEDPSGEINTRGAEIEEREYTLTITHVHRDEEFESASTQIEVIDAGPDKDDEERPEPTPFSIATINGEDADQVNEVPFYRGQPLTVELDGIDPDGHYFEAYLDDQRVGSLYEDNYDEISIRDAEIEEREYTLTITAMFRGEDAESASTQIEVIDAGPDKDDEERPEPTPFSIATVNGEDADQVNEVPFYRGQPLTVELDGIDLERNHFEAYLDDQRVGSLHEDPSGEIITRGAEIEEREYTLTITHVHRDEEFESASTQIEVIDAGPDKDDQRSPDETEPDDDGPDKDDEGSPDEAEPDDDEPGEDEMPGLGIWSALAALGSACYLLGRRFTAGTGTTEI